MEVGYVSYFGIWNHSIKCILDNGISVYQFQINISLILFFSLLGCHFLHQFLLISQNDYNLYIYFLHLQILILCSFSHFIKRESHFIKPSCIQIPSLLMQMYSTSLDNRVTTCSFFEHHQEIGVSPYRNMHAVVDFLSSLSPHQLESMYPSNLQLLPLSSVLNKMSQSINPLIYLRILLVAAK